MKRRDEEQKEASSNRVRHVPIYVESLSHTLNSGPESNDQVDEKDYQNQSNMSHRQTYHHNHSAPPNRDSNLQNAYAHDRYPSAKQEAPSKSTSSIDITYRPEGRTHSHQQTTARRHQGLENPNYSFPQSNESERGAQREDDKSSNKENKNSSVSVDESPSLAALDDKNTDEESQSRPKTPLIIPLPPPDPIRSANNNQTKNDTDAKGAESSAEFKKPKKEGPLAVIMNIKQEVGKLLKEIAACNVTSTKSREYVRLDELLTRCILRLDDIECGDIQNLRQQRKAVIEFIDKCTDILQRKVQLNHDITQLSSKSS